jgi:hypothetical protein
MTLPVSTSAGQELQRDPRSQVREDGLAAWPVRIQQRTELTGRGDPQVHNVITGAHHSAQCPGLTGVQRGDPEPVLAQPLLGGNASGKSPPGSCPRRARDPGAPPG